MTAVEKLKEAEAEQKLIDLGYKKITCPKCAGHGFLSFGILMPKCWTCRGDGIAWEKKTP